MVRIVFVADTHSQLNMIKYKIPESDMIIHAGDWTYRGTTEEYVKEIDIFNSLPHKYKVGILGNHDRLGEKYGMEYVKNLSNDTIILQNESVSIEGIKIYGSASTPWFHSWGFNIRGYDNLAAEWAKIPDDTELLITHGPPHGVLDKNLKGQNCGCEAMWARLHHLPDLRIHAFGHIHHEAGAMYYPSMDRLFVNASICNEQYYPNNMPIVIDYDPITKIISQVE